ncbi:SDR family oxidoreductase [Nocardia sp. NPDC005366]|uniref:SDR family oxidoreductase n=1 Tax=Nocardia sp. NPDC005366 TaxID=3156878 RepID=UPI0033B48F37
MTTVGIVTGAGRGMGLACAQRLSTMVDVLLVADLDKDTIATAAETLTASGTATIEPVVVDISDAEGVAGLAARVAELGTLRAVAHVAGISPTMADWRRIFTVDLIGTALLARELRPLVTTGTATVCFASMAPILAGLSADETVAAILDDPLDENFLDALREALGPAIEDPGAAYSWAKYGVQRFVRREAVRIGPSGGRICSVSPGMIDTPQGRQEAQQHASMEALVARTPVGRTGRPEELAAVVAFALSDEASFLSGVDLLVDGGVCAAVRG